MFRRAAGRNRSIRGSSLRERYDTGRGWNRWSSALRAVVTAGLIGLVFSSGAVADLAQAQTAPGVNAEPCRLDARCLGSSGQSQVHRASSAARLAGRRSFEIARHRSREAVPVSVADPEGSASSRRRTTQSKSPSNDTFTDGAGTGLWSNAGNWSAGLPNSGDNVLVTRTGAAASVTEDINATINNLTLGSGNTWTLANGNVLTVDGFDILNASSVNCGWTIDGLAINSSEHFAETCSSGKVVLTVKSGALGPAVAGSGASGVPQPKGPATPEPGSLLLLGTVLLALSWFLRRRGWGQ